MTTETVTQAAASTTPVTPGAVVRRYIEAIIAGDGATVADSFTEDAVWSYPGDLPLSRDWRGRDTIVNEFLGGVRTLFAPDGMPVVTLTNLLADGDTVVAEWTAVGTAVTGLRYENHCLGLFTVRDGRIAAVREYLDTAHVGRVLFGTQG
ncbi:limonene-1,2-epoxide hydrolase [Kitasatospora sp. MMS16-BH015]|uniref:nuclear transport factor 2 family protein n=1 Tax=Kitasatospora sp. MMS16-BH015 TaxID=2018025 RepID=UPI000CA1F47A|nr:nuclear transport factor 2 family protein [Kitasatospora sp. MMS16-BH015]AUG76327.1 limonene-1,2-epoxide hydrolase [Kitasatospora sp. MMS16-BH015]